MRIAVSYKSDPMLVVNTHLNSRDEGRSFVTKIGLSLHREFSDRFGTDSRTVR